VSDVREEEVRELGEVVPDDEPAGTTDYIEFLGTDPATYGTKFHTSHAVSKMHFKKYHDVTTPKDLTWEKGANGRFLVPVSDMSPEAAEVLDNDPMFKRVTLDN
jgi:hypothetical protein